jgi:hypothetical protein
MNNVTKLFLEKWTTQAPGQEKTQDHQQFLHKLGVRPR